MKEWTLTTADWKGMWHCGEEEGQLHDRRSNPGELQPLEHVVSTLDVCNGHTQIFARLPATFTPRMADGSGTRS